MYFPLRNTRAFVKRLGKLFSSVPVSEPRKRPIVQLKSILALIVLMPVFEVNTISGLDLHSRDSLYLRKLLGSIRIGKYREIIASESTIHRVIPQVDREELNDLLYWSMKISMKTHGASYPLDTGITRTLGVIDGTCLFKHKWYSVIARVVKEGTFIQGIQPYTSRGHERDASIQLMREQGDKLPELLLFDGLYPTKRILQTAQELHRHVLIKYGVNKKDGSARKKELFLIDDARCIMDSPDLSDPEEAVTGCDSSRKGKKCEYRIETVRSKWEGVPVQIMRVTETVRGSHGSSQYWIITTDMGLTARAAREAAYLRWRIENDIFKRMSELSETKKVRTHNTACAERVFHCIAIGLNMITRIIADRKQDKNHRLPHKATWKSLTTALCQTLPELVRRKGWVPVCG